MKITNAIKWIIVIYLSQMLIACFNSSSNSTPENTKDWNGSYPDLSNQSEPESESEPEQDITYSFEPHSEEDTSRSEIPTPTPSLITGVDDTNHQQAFLKIVCNDVYQENSFITFEVIQYQTSDAFICATSLGNAQTCLCEVKKIENNQTTTVLFANNQSTFCANALAQIQNNEVVTSNGKDIADFTSAVSNCQYQDETSGI